jgi:hypothetical protein
MIDVSWRELAGAEPEYLKGEVFRILAEAGRQLRGAEGDSPDLVSLVPRLWDLVNSRQELDGYKEVLNAFARSCGLWNYIDQDRSDDRDALVAAAVTAPELDGVVFHREQVAALNVLLAGRSLILSAPTSFGKSLLIDALVASGRYSRIAIVVPTIALLDETRRRIGRRFGDRFQLLMYNEDAASSDRVIFLGTQERLIARRDIGRLDLLVVDEFYKLDPAREDERSITLNSAVYRLLKAANQFFFLGPNIEQVRVEGDGRWRFEFLRTRFSTVAVDTFDLSGEADKEGRLIKEATKVENLPALVFASSPDRANTLATDFVEEKVSVGQGGRLADWIVENFGAEWEISSAIRNGVGVHHGRVPRALAARLIIEFNRGVVPILICTSTLIEGVNTSAKSVLIYDKQINRRDYDFFTFSNIRGRAGRLGRHHVGNVYLFNDAPAKTDMEVSAPLFEDLDDAPDDMLIHLEPEDRTAEANFRVKALEDQLSLSSEELRIAGTIGLDNAVALQHSIEERYSGDARLSWAGYPSFDDIVAVSDVINSVRSVREYGVGSPRQLAFYIAELRKPRDIRYFYRWHMGNVGQKYRESVFKFLRGCEYGIPQWIAVVELLVRRYFPQADYSVLIGGLPVFFRPTVLKHLDEQGVPLQISERFYQAGDTVRSLSTRLLTVAVDPRGRLSPLEADWVNTALGR